jgi:acyl-CoA reductase-like NAD-dependent aldehyde dehydrogenase
MSMSSAPMRDASSLIQSWSPQRPTDLVGEWSDVGTAGLDRAVAAARDAQPAWLRAGPGARASVLDDAATSMWADRVALTELVIREVGKPRAEAAGEIARAVSILRYYAQAAFDSDGETFPAIDGRSWLLARRRPRGVVGLITPWNFPIAIPVWKLAPALAWGNAVVLKPSREAMACAHRISSYFGSADVLHVVAAGADSTRAWMQSSGVDAVSFTGSAAVGQGVAAAAVSEGIPFQVEMGGSNASIVFPDADPASTATTIAGAAMAFAGQKCTATRRIIVVGPNADFTEALVEAVAAMRPGDPDAATTTVGPVISEGAAQRVVDARSAARRDGARVLIGERKPDLEGHFVEPALVDGVDPASELAREEVFGPLAAIMHVPDEAAAAAVSAATRYGLVTSVFTSDLERAMRMVERVDTGLVRVNAPTTGVDFHAPFGGEKGSSQGPREQGRAVKDLMTRLATITVSPGSSRAG